MPIFQPRMAALALPLVLLAGCEDLVLATASVPVPAPVTAQPVETVPPATGTPAAGTPAMPAPRPTLAREGAQVVTLEIVNATDLPIIQLSAVAADGRPGENLLPPGMGIAPGGRFDLPASPGPYRLSARLQAPGPFAQGRQVLRNVVVPGFPPNPPPRMPVTLR